MSKDNGGPAFPGENPLEFVTGMTLRDYFAAKAMAGMLSDPTVACDGVRLSRIAYAHADAMLAERDK